MTTPKRNRDQEAASSVKPKQEQEHYYVSRSFLVKLLSLQNSSEEEQSLGCLKAMGCSAMPVPLIWPACASVRIWETDGVPTRIEINDENAGTQWNLGLGDRTFKPVLALVRAVGDRNFPRKKKTRATPNAVKQPES